MAQFRLAYEQGAHARLWEDAADWAKTSIHVLNLGDVIDLGDLEALNQRETAFRGAGEGSLLSHSDDAQFAALAALVEIESGGRSIRAARSALRRYQRRSLVLGAVDQEITAHDLLGRLYMHLNDSDSAIGHFIKS